MKEAVAETNEVKDDKLLRAHLSLDLSLFMSSVHTASSFEQMEAARQRCLTNILQSIESVEKFKSLNPTI